MIMTQQRFSPVLSSIHHINKVLSHMVVHTQTNTTTHTGYQRGQRPIILATYSPSEVHTKTQTVMHTLTLNSTQQHTHTLTHNPTHHHTHTLTLTHNSTQHHTHTLTHNPTQQHTTKHT